MGNQESHISRAIEAWLNWQPDIMAWRQNAGAIRRQHTRKDGTQGGQLFRGACKGAGDITGIIKPGFRIEVEVKTAKGTQNANQKAFEKELAKFGGYYLLVRSIRDVEEGVERIRHDIKARRHT